MALQKYREFWGRNPQSVTRRHFRVPGTLIFLGRVNAIEYISNKFNGGGDGKTAVYRHKFKSGSKLYMDEKAGGQLYIMGSRIVVDEGGIRN